MKIGGEWQATSKTGPRSPDKQLCRNRKASERIEELILVVSNSEVNRGVEGPFRFPKQVPMLASTSNVGCFDWMGKASATVSGRLAGGVDSTTRPRSKSCCAGGGRLPRALPARHLVR